jgi:hypothetical protein
MSGHSAKGGRLLLALLCAALGLGGCGSSSDKNPASARTVAEVTGRRAVLVFRARGGGQTVNAKSLAATAAIMRERLKGLGVPAAIQVSGKSEITLTVATTGNLQSTEPSVTRTAQLLFYDWEPNVIGPTGEPAPTEASVTGGAEAGSPYYGLTEYQAEPDRD